MSQRPDNPIFQHVPDGRLLAIRNWRHRSHEDDALIAVPLNPREVDRYSKLKGEGLGDEAIFDALFSPPITERVSLSITELTKGQLLGLVRQLVREDLDSVDRMSREDLVVLVRALCRPRRGCEGFLV